MQEENRSTWPIPSTDKGSANASLPVVLTNLTKYYGPPGKNKPALQDVSFTIEPGIFGLLGKNGAGKTTLLQILATLMEPTSGEARIGSYHTRRDRWSIRKQVGLGFLPQEQGYYPQLTVKQTLKYLAALQGLTRSKQAIEEALEAVNLTDRAGSPVKSLSGGMRRRLGLAQALLGNPKILIVDEPTAGLDPVEQQRFRTLLGTLGARRDRTIILSTHIVADISTVATHLAVLEKGQLVFHGTTRDLARRAQGYSWLWRTTIEEVEAVQANGSMVITSITPVIDALSPANAVVARVEGARPSANAVPCEPTLEDGYFTIIGGASQDEDDIKHRLAEKSGIKYTR
jgi:ABC-2 type transport system ATP-binding protein